MPPKITVHRLAPTAFHLEPLDEHGTSYLVRANLIMANGRQRAVEPVKHVHFKLHADRQKWGVDVSNMTRWAHIPTGLSIDLPAGMVGKIYPLPERQCCSFLALPCVLTPEQKRELVIPIEVRSGSHHYTSTGAKIMQGQPLAKMIFEEIPAVSLVQAEGVPERLL